MDGLIPSTEEGLVTLAAPKLLSLGNAQINLAFHSFTRNFAVWNPFSKAILSRTFFYAIR